MKTVSYNKQTWAIDAENNELYLKNNKKVRVDIDDVFDFLSDKDQNKVAEALVVANRVGEENFEEDYNNEY